MTDLTNDLTHLLTLKQQGPNEFEGQSLNPGWNRVYGGQVIAQAIIAVNTTTDPEKQCHSMHAYFLRPGNPDAPITYTVTPVRDGRSFQTRALEASQNNETIFTMTASFHKQEPGPEHQDEPGPIPAPEDLPPVTDLMQKYGDKLPKAVSHYFTRERPFELRPLDISRYMQPKPAPATQSFWIKPTQPLEDDLALHQAALGYASDFTLLDTALIPHGKLLFDPSLMLASLDHSIWFHRPFTLNDWILYKQTSSSASNARALCHGQFFNRQGLLIASTTQEGLTRPVTLATKA